ncbi:hypothetical protein BV20DRAFT_701913 [Pilatotrama ljubarskyi]|nr:hypothetical protein BV20DRAFT_701913 [Pilatotrama ljubarskyi]
MLLRTYRLALGVVIHQSGPPHGEKTRTHTGTLSKFRLICCGTSRCRRGLLWSDAPPASTLLAALDALDSVLHELYQVRPGGEPQNLNLAINRQCLGTTYSRRRARSRAQPTILSDSLATSTWSLSATVYPDLVAAHGCRSSISRAPVDRGEV